jgi:cytochrome c553
MMKARILLVAALFAASTSALASSGDASAGKKKSTTCAACHGAEGVSPSPEFPNLAGQYPDYLEKVITHYQNGKRKNPIMAAQVKSLSHKDVADLAAYFSAMKGLKVQH